MMRRCHTSMQGGGPRRDLASDVMYAPDLPSHVRYCSAASGIQNPRV